MNSLSRHSKPLRLREFFHNHFVQWFTLSAILVNALLWGVVAYAIRPSEIPILLRFNVYLGYDLSSLTDWRYAYSIPAIAIVLLFFNTFIAFLLFRQPDRFAAHSTLFGGLLVQCCALIAGISIILTNS